MTFHLLPTVIIITLRQVRHKWSYIALLIFSSGPLAMNLKSVDKTFSGRARIVSPHKIYLRSPPAVVFWVNVGPQWFGLKGLTYICMAEPLQAVQHPITLQMYM
jgi:hypothetical protein